MIVWLASYPRSGNTLTRTIFKNVFDIDTYSDEVRKKDSWEEINQSIGHIDFEGGGYELYRAI